MAFKHKKFKLYTHHFSSVEAHRRPEGNRSGPKKRSLVFWILGMCYKICFQTGHLLVRLAIGIRRRALKQWEATMRDARMRFKLLRQPQYRRGLVIFILLACIGWGAFKSAGFVANGLELKQRVLGTAMLGGQHLRDARQAVENQNVHLAQSEFNKAVESFRLSQKELESSGSLINKLLSVLPQKRDADKLLRAGVLVSESGKDLANFYREMQDVKFTPEGLTVQNGASNNMPKRLSSYLNSASDKIHEANKLVKTVNTGSLPKSQQAQFAELASSLDIISKALNNVQALTAATADLISGDKHLLLLFENNNELRAGGGFIGTYGSLRLKDGHIEQLAVKSIYDLDGQLADKIAPPSPLLNVNPRWYMRDANWFADFPESARKVSGFYEKEGGQTPDAVLAITPSFIQNLLKLTGPIPMPGFGVTLDSENFIEQTQVITSVQNESPINDPKQMLGTLFPVLLQRISTLEKTQYPQLLAELQNGFAGKQILIYSRNPETQARLSEFNWTGELRGTDRDYFSVVSSNLGGTKTDLYVDQKIALETFIEEDGSVRNELTITRANNLPKLSGTSNVSFIRVFVPSGSALVSNTGFDFKNIVPTPDSSLKTDPDALKWESKAVRESISGTMIGQESGKTFFGNWMEVEGGQTKSAKLVYRLPFKLNAVDRYSLLLQKQPGAKASDVSYAFHFPQYRIDWKNFDTNDLDTSRLGYEFKLDKDRFLGTVLVKR